MLRRGVLHSGEKIQFTDRKGKRITAQLVEHGRTQTDHGLIDHDQVIGRSEGVVVSTLRAKPERDEAKPWKAARAMGGWSYTVMRPRLCDYVLSMPRGAQIMYPKDIAQMLELGDIRSGMRVLESGAGSGALSMHLLDAVGEQGELTTVELRAEFARVAQANATLYFGTQPQQWRVKVGDLDHVAQELQEQYFDRVVLDMVDPWNRLDAVYRVIAPGGVLAMYVTTATQMARVAEKLRESGHWTEPEIQETLERTWKAQALSVRPNHQMIGHTGFIVTTRAMAQGTQALSKQERPTKQEAMDIDMLSDEELTERWQELSLRDISDRKLRKVLTDLDKQMRQL